MEKRAQVSSRGRFRSTKGIISKPSPRADGYVEVAVNGKKYLLHRLIAIAFRLLWAEGQRTINHIDGNPSNNALSNLEFASRSEQIHHSYATNTERKSSARKQSKPVHGRRVNDTNWVRYPSAREAARQLGLDPGHISACCRKTQHQTGGYEFELAESSEPEQLDGEEWRDVIV